MKRLTAISVVLVVFLALLIVVPGLVSAEGTEELGPPSISIASGSNIIAAGTGMNLRGDPGTIQVDVPAGATVRQVLLYWSGRSAQIEPGDDAITVNGTLVTGAHIGGPAFFESCNDCDVLPFDSYRADVTALNLVAPGTNELVIDDMDFSRESNGAAVLVIYDDGSGASQIQLRDGIDLAYIRSEEPGKTTVPQTFTFAAQNSERTAELVIFAASVKPNRPNIIRITVAGQTTELVNELHSTDGPDWDTLNLPVTIPAGATEVTVQLFSESDGTSRLPASMAWIVATLSVPEPPDQTEWVCADFGQLSPGASVEGPGAVHPNFNITTSSGQAVVVHEGVQPIAYGSPNGPGSIPNNGVGDLALDGQSSQGFFDRSRNHDYVFTLAPGVTANEFIIKMLDFGDFNPDRATEHQVILVAYDSNNNVVDSDTLEFTSDGTVAPTSGSAGNLQFTGDASRAQEGQPGNFTFHVVGFDIVRVELQFSSDVSPTAASDPQFALSLLCYVPEPPDQTEWVCADFGQLSPGASVEGPGAVHPNFNITTSSGRAVVVHEGVQPVAYGAPNGPGSIPNNGVGDLALDGQSSQGFFDRSRNHDYVFTLAPGVTANEFIIKMLDFGDFNPTRATEHRATLVAYDSNNAVVDSHLLQFTSDGTVTPTGGSAGNLQFTGDADSAQEGQPGNFTFHVAGAGIVRVELQFSSDVSPTAASDPNFALALLCHVPEQPPDPPETVCGDFSQLPPGASAEGLGTVHQALNINALSGTAVSVEEGVTPVAYGAPNGPGSIPNNGVGGLAGFFDSARVHNYEFTFAPGITVNFFSVKVLDFGDFNPPRATEHQAALVAYGSNGVEIDSHLLEFTSDGTVTPTSGSAGNLQLTGDASTALPGQPGNFTFRVGGEGITRVELEFSSNVNPAASSDPNIALALLCFNLEQP